MLYDREVSAAVTQAGCLYGVALEPALVHGIIERETGHRPYSTAGTLEPNGHRSYGPMQVQDTTAAMHGIADPDTLNIPSVGIRIGTYELARLFKLFPGDIPRAIAAYNAGPGNAVRSKTTGLFPNQSYVDFVMRFWRSVKSAPAPAVAGLALVAGLVFALFRRRRSVRTA